MEQPENKSNKKVIIIILVVIGVLGLSGFVCCAGAIFWGVGEAQNMEKTYYSECENLESSDACNRCCVDKGHSGHVHGEMLNEEGKVCGCI